MTKISYFLIFLTNFAAMGTYVLTSKAGAVLYFLKIPGRATLQELAF